MAWRLDLTGEKVPALGRGTGGAGAGGRKGYPRQTEIAGARYSQPQATRWVVAETTFGSQAVFYSPRVVPMQMVPSTMLMYIARCTFKNTLF